MKSTCILAALCFGLLLSLGSTAHAQGGADDPVAGALGEGIGTIDENARYLQENRTVEDFVGADSSEDGAFVGGAGENVDLIESAIDTSIRTQVTNRILAEAINRRTGMYGPRLQVNFAVSPRPTPVIGTELTHRLQTSIASRTESSIRVSLEFGLATLSGTVHSTQERRLAELLTLFEPGVSRVDNQLTIASGLPAPASLRQPR